MTKKLTGLHPLAYMGVNSEKPPNLTMHDRNPAATDYQGFSVGSLWLYPSANRAYMLMEKAAGVSTWLQIQTAGGGDDVEGLITDDALTSTPDGVGKITISGGSNLTTSQVSAHDLKVALDNTVSITGDFTASGAISGNTLTVGSLGAGVVQSDAVGVISSSNGTAGQLMIGGGAAPAWATVSAGSGITLTPGANTLEIAATSAGNDLIPGTIVKFDGTPSGSWLACDGSSLAQVGTYADLFAEIGHEYMLPTYALQTTTFTGTIYCVAHNGLSGADGLWVAAGANGELETSPDGITWTSRTSQFGADIIYGVSHTGLTGGDALWTAVGANAKISTSPDGVTWTAQTSNFLGGGIFSVKHNGLTGGSSLWVAVGGSTGFSTSADGVTWVYNTTGTGTGTLTDVTYNNTMWACIQDVGASSTIIKSASGTSWATTFTSPYLIALTSSPSLFMSVGSANSYAPQVSTSPDGYSFKFLGSATNQRSYPYAIGYGDDYFTVGTYNYGGLARSKDGVTWEDLATPFNVGTHSTYGDTIYGIASNDYAAPDTAWVAVSDNNKLALGVPSINTATHFYIPNMPGYVILY